VKTFCWGDEHYPFRLAQCPDAPLLLFGRGRLPLDRPRQLAVVGTRHPTDYGQRLAKRTVELLSAYRPVVVSGLASGVDGVAHRTALSVNLPTVGVLGHGLKSLFPAEHRSLLEEMLERGGVVTEYLSDVPPLPQHFPPRNRIIAGLSDAVVVVEARRRSGALITANLGFSYNREVFAYPGRLTDDRSEGCNNLIRRNKASLLMQPSEVADSLGWHESSGEKQPSAALSLPFDLTEPERKVYGFIVSLDCPDADSLMEATGYDVPELSAILLSLECKSVVRKVAGQRYRQV
jgi:DNA processing protein